MSPLYKPSFKTKILTTENHTKFTDTKT